MATKTTGWLCTHSASVTSQTDTTATITVTCYWKNNGWTYDINNVSAWVYCGGQSKQVKTGGAINAQSSTTQSVSCGSATFTITKTKANQAISCYAKITSNSSYVSGTKSSTAASVSVSTKKSYAIAYNANGGTSAPGNQTKWYGETLTLTSIKPSRSGYTFKNWNTATNGSGTAYSSGASYTANAAATLYAQWTASSYTITYNANGGSNAPASQTKAHGATINISTTEPTRSGHIFNGWSNSASSSTVLYRPGDSYTANANITLYAVWTKVAPPTITNFSVDRCKSNGTLDENGEYALIKFDWSIDSASTTRTAGIKSYVIGSSTVHNQLAPSLNSATGSYSGVLGSSSKLFDKETSYTIALTITDQFDSTTASLVLGDAAYSIELIPNNGGVRLPKAVHGNVLGLADLPEITDNANANDYTITGVWSVKTNATAATVANLPIAQAGRLIVAHAIGGRPTDSEFDYLIQTYIPYVVKYPIYERHVRKTDSSTWIYSPWVVITRNRHSMISAWTGSDITKTATGLTQIPLTGYTVVGDGLTISNNAIVIGQYITAVEVSAAGLILCKSGSNNQAKNLVIQKNGTEVAISMNSSWSTNTANFQLNVSPKLITVAEGDKITFHWYASYNSTSKVGDILDSPNARTYITVKEF